MPYPAKTVYIFFGEMGAGKNYYGWQFVQNLMLNQKVKAASFFDGDWVVTPEILDSVQNFKTLTTEMIGKYVKVLAAAIEEELKSTDNLVVAQALYFNSDREWLTRYLTNKGCQ
jgi:hypothetical protein